MKILQLSDLHITANGGLAFHQADSLSELRHTVDYILDKNISPDTVVVTGDVSSDGSVSSYMLAKNELARLSCPIHVLSGNHDDKNAMEKVFGEFCFTEQPGHHGRRIDLPGITLLLMDSAAEGRSRGGISIPALQWLRQQLVSATRDMTLLMMHHFPFRSGYPIMDEPFENEDALLDLLPGQNDLQICCGHLHAGLFTHRHGITMMTCPAVSMLMELDLHPQGGNHFYTAQPGFALHVAENGNITSHLCCVPACDRFGGPYPFIE